MMRRPKRNRPVAQSRTATGLAAALALALAAGCGDPGDGGTPGQAAPATDTGRVDTPPSPVGADAVTDTTGRDTTHNSAVAGQPDPAVGEPAAPSPPASDATLTGFDTVYVYFTGSDEEQAPVPRPVSDTAHALRAAFVELLEGPTTRERDRGLLSWFSGETAGMLRGVAVEEGFAVVDLEDLRPVIPNAVGSAGALMLLGELTATAFQFPGVRRVEFRIDGDCEALMAWLQFGCSPIRRGSWDPPPGFRTAVRDSVR